MFRISNYTNVPTKIPYEFAINEIVKAKVASWEHYLLQSYKRY